jgi:hypothetical protein
MNNPIDSTETVHKIKNILGDCVHDFAGECSISSDILGKNIQFIRIGCTDEDVAEYPNKNWIQIHLKNGNILIASLLFFDMKKQKTIDRS